jgi:Na+/citrate or Na+/malate symporter
VLRALHAVTIHACHSGGGVTGGVAACISANQMQIKAFAQIATRMGEALTVALVLTFLSRLV